MRSRATALMLATLVLVCAPLAALNGSETTPADPSTLVAANQFAKWNQQYAEASWDVLSSFEYPIPAYGKKLSDRKIILPADVKKLDGQKVAIRGYMLPLDMDEKGLTQFILGPDLNTCCFAVVGLPNEWIVVTMAKKTVFTRYDPITVYGTLHSGEIARRDDGIQNVESFYRIDGVAMAIHTEAFEKATGGK